MRTVFLGLTISLVYGGISSLIIWLVEGQPTFLDFVEAYTTSFRTLVSLGLILGTALVVYRTQALIPEVIESAISQKQLRKTGYHKYKSRYCSLRRSVTFASEFIVIAFVLFRLCQFPLSTIAENFMMAAVCAEYACGVYIGRKLCYGGLMLHSLLQIKIERNLFENHELDEINSYVNIISTLTILFVYVHVYNYFDAPFLCESVLGEGARLFLILPAVIAAPVLLIFNFYPRIVLKKMYSDSIDAAIKILRGKLRQENLSTFEARSYLIEFEKMRRDELRYRLRLSLSDLPFGVVILVMVLEPLLGR